MVVGVAPNETNGRCVNLSSGGLCGELGSAIPTGEVQALRLSLVFGEAKSEALVLQGRAVWCTQIGEVWQVGFQFLAINQEQRSFLKIFLGHLGE